MKKLLVFLTLTFVLQCFGQKKAIESRSSVNQFRLEKIRDSISENGIKITDHDVVSDGINYLYSVNSKIDRNTCIIVQAERPLELNVLITYVL